MPVNVANSLNDGLVEHFLKHLYDPVLLLLFNGENLILRAENNHITMADIPKHSSIR